MSLVRSPAAPWHGPPEPQDLSSAAAYELDTLADFVSGPFQPRCSLDTGRLNPETYRLFDKVEKHYGIRIEYTFPDAQVRIARFPVCPFARGPSVL